MARFNSRRVPVAILSGLLLVLGVLGVVANAGAAPGDNPAANLDQCANGSPASPTSCVTTAWQNGNLNSSNSHYREDEGVPFRAVLTGLTPAIPTSLVIEYDNTQSHVHAYDYLVSFDFSESDANPCSGVTPCVGPTTVAVDTDTTLAAASPAVPQAAGSIAVYNGTATGFDYVSQPAGPEGQSNTTQAEVTFTPLSSTVVVAWAGHIASSEDWGEGDSAAGLNGSSYHMRLIELNGETIGNQDRSLKASAVLRHDAGVLAIAKSATETEVEHGDTIHYTMLVTYTPGTDGSPAQDIAVTDPQCASAPVYQSGDANSDGLLQGTETWTYTCTYTVASAHTAGETNPILNVATVNGNDLDDDPLTEVVSNQVSVAIVHDEGDLDIVKSADKTSVEHGDTITYTFTVTYEPAADGSPAANVTVSDDKCDGGAATYVSGDTNSDDLLQGTESWVFECEYDVPASHSSGEENPVVNQAEAEAEDVDGDAIGPVDSNEVSIPLVHDQGTLAVVKSADKTQVAHGGTVTYSFSVTYTPASDGAAAADVALVDAQCTSGPTFTGGDANADGLLQGTETWTYTCTYSVPAAHDAGEEDPILNTATASGEDDDGDPLPTATSNTVQVDLVHAGVLVVDKSVNTPSFNPGDTATFTYVVTNAGGDAISSVVLTDDKCSPVSIVSGDANGDGKLQASETWTYTCSHGVSDAGDITNVATVTGVDVAGNALKATDSVTISVVLAEVIVAKPAEVLGVKLPRTGSDVAGLVAAGLALVLVGLGLMFTTRRRGAHHM